MPNHKSNLKSHPQIMNHFPQIKSNHKSHFNFKMKFKGKCVTGSTVYMAALDARKMRV